MKSTLRRRLRLRLGIYRIGAAALGLLIAARAGAAPNLVANGDLEQPRQEAEGRLSPTESEIIFEISGEAGFGRVIARGLDVGPQLKKSMKVGYVQTANAMRGLMIDTRDVEAKNNYEVSVWFDLKGQVRPGRQYAYSVFCLPADENGGIPDLTMIAPAIWADGKLMGSTIPLSWPATGENLTLEDLTRSGVVKTPDYKHQTGGQWLVLKLPTSFKSRLLIKRVSLRELDDALLAGKQKAMPTPTRYIPVDDILEDDIAYALTRGTEAIQSTQSPEGFWQGGSVDESVGLTADLLEVLGRRGVDLSEKPMRKALDWLAEQEPTATGAVASRLMFLSRYGREEYRQTIAKDVMRLSKSQFDDGGWNESSADDVQKDRKLHAANGPTFSACLALYEAHYAGVEADARVWRNAAGYWRKAQTRDGGFRAMLDSYGGLGEATTTANTALGLAGLLITLDMAFADGSERCTQYLSNSEHRDGLLRGLEWMEEYYDEYYKMLPTLDAQPDPFFNASGMLALTKASGARRFRDKDVYRTEAENFLRYFDANSGLFAGSLVYTGLGVFMLHEGGSPTVVQRLILGGAPEFRLSRDAAHLVRYLIEERKRSLNWAETDLETKIEEWVMVPVLYVHAAGEQEVTEAQWRRIRDYCFGGGVVVCNIAEDYEPGRAQIEAGLKLAFPEYPLKELSASDSFWAGDKTTDEDKLTAIPGVRTISNGLKHLVFVLPQDWSCRLNTYQRTEHPETFEFFDRLLSYTLDSEEPRSNFEFSTWDLPAVATQTVRVRRMEIGGAVPAYPDLLETLNRTLRAEYRLQLEPASEGDTQAVPLLWISCAGPKPMTDEQRKQIRASVEGGAFVFADVLTGNTNWAESFRSDLLRSDDTFRVRKLPANHPLVNGRLYETFGYDLRETHVRRALREEMTKLPRLDAYVIEKDGREVGVLSVHDVTSGLGYVLYPDCRGLMPAESRQTATNVVLYAMQRQLQTD